MVAFFFGRHLQLGEHLVGPWVRVLAEAAAAGTIGGTLVVLWFLFYDLGSGSNPFRTPAMFGGVILEGARNPGAVAASSPSVMSYTVLHFAVFVAFGVVVASLAASLDEPLLWLSFLLVSCLFQAFFVGFASVLSDALLNQTWMGHDCRAQPLVGLRDARVLLPRRRALHPSLQGWVGLRINLLNTRLLEEDCRAETARATRG
jgi:hypothetical protein